MRIFTVLHIYGLNYAQLPIEPISARDHMQGIFTSSVWNFRARSEEGRLFSQAIQQDNLLKLQRKTIDDLSSDLSSHAQLSQEMFSQQSAHIKKLQEENQSLQKKHFKTLESNLALQKSCNELLTEVNFLKDQVRELWKKTLDTHANSEADIDPHAISHSSPSFLEETDKVHPPLLLVDIPTENPVQEIIMRNEKILSPNAQQLRKNGSSNQSPPISVKPNTAAFLCDSNGKFLNMTKPFHPKRELKYFRCPTIEDGRNTSQTSLQEHPRLLVIHTGTNNLTSTSQVILFLEFPLLSRRFPPSSPRAK